MSSISNAVKIYIIAAVIFFILICYILYYFTIGYSIDRKENRERFLNNSIPYYITSDLCSKGVIPEFISDCLGEEIFIERSKSYDIFDYNLKNFSNYNDVQAVFGIYQVFCTQPENNEYSCLYQLEASPGVSVTYEEKTNDMMHWN